MAEYGICENQQCELCYTNFQDLLGWLNGHPNDNQRPPDNYLLVFQQDTHCATCGTVVTRITQHNTPALATHFIQAIDLLRGRGVLEWP
jgi:hypothetical protein